MDILPSDLRKKPDLDDIALEYGKLVSAVCRRMIRDEDIAKDAAQQVWTEIVKSYPAFRGESKVSTWIYTITRRVAMAQVMHERTISTRVLSLYSFKEEFDFPCHADLDKKIWVKQMCDKCITGILHCVDNETRLAHMLRDVAELEYAEIAEILERDVASVRQIVSRSRRKVNSFLGDTCTLYNPEGACRCRMKKRVQEVDLVSEYRKIGEITRRVNFYKKSEQIFPGKNFWEKLL
jgi:RNA polymerase sigma-70 factor (ECF subfamily)